MEETNVTTHNDYGLKAGGVLASLEKFKTLFGLQLLFGCAENTLTVLHTKDISLIQEALSAVVVTQSFYRRQRNKDAFDTLQKT